MKSISREIGDAKLAVARARRRDIRLDYIGTHEDVVMVDQRRYLGNGALAIRLGNLALKVKFTPGFRCCRRKCIQSIENGLVTIRDASIASDGLAA